MDSNQYLFRCASTIKADPNISEDTIVVMFVEFKRLVLEELKPENNGFVPYPVSKPRRAGRYEVYRSNGKQHYEQFDSKRFVYNDNDILFWRHVVNPEGKCTTL